MLAQLAHAISSELPKNETLRYPPQKQAASSPAVSVTLFLRVAVHHAEGGRLFIYDSVMPQSSFGVQLSNR